MADLNFLLVTDTLSVINENVTDEGSSCPSVLPRTECARHEVRPQCRGKGFTLKGVHDERSQLSSSNITSRESPLKILDKAAQMIIMCHINRIDFARNPVTINVSRGVIGWRLNEAFGHG